MFYYGIVYYIIFHKHHKRNKIELDELVSSVVKFYSLTILSILLLIIGFFVIINSVTYKYDRNEIIVNISFGTVLNIITVLNYIKYLKDSLKDYDSVIREANRKATLRLGEILQFIFFVIMALIPIWRLPYLIKMFDNTQEFGIELTKVLAISAASIFLLYNLNPLDIKNKMFKRKGKKNKEENIEQEIKENN